MQATLMIKATEAGINLLEVQEFGVTSLSDLSPQRIAELDRIMHEVYSIVPEDEKEKVKYDHHVFFHNAKAAGHKVNCPDNCFGDMSKGGHGSGNYGHGKWKTVLGLNDFFGVPIKRIKHDINAKFNNGIHVKISPNDFKRAYLFMQGKDSQIKGYFRGVGKDKDGNEYPLQNHVMTVIEGDCCNPFLVESNHLSKKKQKERVNKQGLILDEITSDNLKSLDDDELNQTHMRMHEAFDSLKEDNKDTKNVVLAHNLILGEMEARGLDHTRERGPDRVNKQEPFSITLRHGEDWVDVPESGECPEGYPVKLKFPGIPERCYTETAVSKFDGTFEKAQEEVISDAAYAALRNWGRNFQEVLPQKGKGKFVYHHHWHGLRVDLAKKIDETKFNDLKLLKQSGCMLNGVISFSGRKAVWGWSADLGPAHVNRECSGDRFYDLSRDRGSGKKVQGVSKLFQPSLWLTVGSPKPLVKEPGEVGATAKRHAKLFIWDKGKYELGVIDQHFAEVFLKGRKLKGRLLISLVKDGDHSRWNFEFPKDQTPFADQNQLSDVVKRLKERGDKFLIWGKPGEKPRIIDIGKFKEEEDDE